MREGANRSFGLALLASILLHALLLAALPSLRELAAQLPKVPAPLIARLMQAEAAPSSTPVAHAHKQPAPERRSLPPPVTNPVPVPTPAPIATPVPQAQNTVASAPSPSAPAAAAAVAPRPAAAARGRAAGARSRRAYGAARPRRRCARRGLIRARSTATDCNS